MLVTCLGQYDFVKDGNHPIFYFILYSKVVSPVEALLIMLLTHLIYDWSRDASHLPEMVVEVYHIIQ